MENTTALFGEEPEPGHCKGECYDFEKLNRQLVWFAPKGELDDDSVAVLRTSDNLRTIFGSNADAKLISAGVSDSIVDATLALTPAAQRGFCRGRQLSLNVVDLDTFSRAFNICADIDLTESQISGIELVHDLKEGARAPSLRSSTNLASNLASSSRGQYRGSISDIPAVMLYNFCNAFPTVLHEWMWLVLKTIKLPKDLYRVIKCLYLSIQAFSAGCGDGSFLFEVLGGVKTGCPLSSILFLLCVNPFIDLVIKRCDQPKLSVTRICADDFGSALRSLVVLKTQAKIFYLAARCAGLHLKPSKCVLIITACNLTEQLVSAIRAWLLVNVPEFADVIIASSGKFLGWHLGRQSDVLSFAAPIKKFANRVHEIVAGKAPAAPSIIRYNQRVPTVLSYVSQFAEPPEEYNVASLAHWAVHCILRLPANCYSRKLINSVAFCSGINPLPILSYCASVRYRFAASEGPYLIQLREDFFALVGDSSPLVRVANIIPHGGLDSPSILQCLHDTLNLKGYLHKVYEQIRINPEFAWILAYPHSSLPVGSKGVQSSVLSILSGTEMCESSLAAAVKAKLKVTLGVDSFNVIHFQDDWLAKIRASFANTNSYLSMCWFKAIGGGWTTSVRMHESISLPCVFGCLDCFDEFKHYLVCPILWQLAKEGLGLMETSFEIEHRLCLREVNINRLRLLGYCHTLYHLIRRSPECFDSDGFVRDSRFIQQFAVDSIRAIKPLIPD